MSSIIPYTQTAFNKIANNSMRMHNGQFTDTPINNHIGPQNIMGVIGPEFAVSFINDLDMFIQSVLYDVDIRTKVKNYVDHQFNKWGAYISKSIMKYIQDLDMKYVSVFKERGFLERMFVPYIYENVMITD